MEDECPTKIRSVCVKPLLIVGSAAIRQLVTPAIFNANEVFFHTLANCPKARALHFDLRNIWELPCGE